MESEIPTGVWDGTSTSSAAGKRQGNALFQSVMTLALLADATSKQISKQDFPPETAPCRNKGQAKISLFRVTFPSEDRKIHRKKRTTLFSVVLMSNPYTKDAVPAFTFFMKVWLV